jgi:hypothetical protein
MPDANDLDLAEWREVIACIKDRLASDKFYFSERNRILRSALIRELRPVV